LLSPEKASFAYVRVKYANDEESFREKFVLIVWIGADVKVMRRAKVSSSRVRDEVGVSRRRGGRCIWAERKRVLWEWQGRCRVVERIGVEEGRALRGEGREGGEREEIKLSSAHHPLLLLHLTSFPSLPSLPSST